MRINLIFAFTLFISLLFQAGCGDSGRPADFPKLYSVSVEVTQQDQPLEGATVTLISKTPTTYGTASAQTNASGVAKLLTYGYNGVPSGEYSVLIQKLGTEGAVESRTLEGVPVMLGGQTYNYVDAKYSQEFSTPYSLSVEKKGVKEKFEVGEPVRLLFGNLGD